jgi:glycosyltransferase involved in cell wall biosynthesis
MRLTIGIPSKNGGEKLLSTVKSCINVNLEPSSYEILIIDNHSEDDTVQRLKKLKKEIKNLRIIENPKDIGRTNNWNRCVQKAKGQYFIFLFTGDMIAKENNIAQLLDILDSDLGIGLVMSKFLMLTEKYQRSGRRYIHKSQFVDTEKFLRSFINSARLPCGPLQSMVYRTEQLSQEKFSSELDFVADQIVTINYALHFPKIYLNNKPQFVWMISKERFHSNVDFMRTFTQFLNAVDWINLSIDKKLFYQNLLLIIFSKHLIRREINQEDFRKAKDLLFQKAGYKIGVDVQLIKSGINYLVYLAKL